MVLVRIADAAKNRFGNAVLKSLSRSSTTYKQVVASRGQAESLLCFVSSIMGATRSDVKHIFSRLGGCVGDNFLACQLRPRAVSISIYCSTTFARLLWCPQQAAFWYVLPMIMACCARFYLLIVCSLVIQGPYVLLLFIRYELLYCGDMSVFARAHNDISKLNRCIPCPHLSSADRCPR